MSSIERNSLIATFVILFILFFSIPFLLIFKRCNFEYEYVDLNNNLGYANYCNNNSGFLQCEKSNSIVNVKSFKLIPRKK